jgi:hypothetical protein
MEKGKYAQNRLRSSLNFEKAITDTKRPSKRNRIPKTRERFSHNLGFVIKIVLLSEIDD